VNESLGQIAADEVIEFHGELGLHGEHLLHKLQVEEPVRECMIKPHRTRAHTLLPQLGVLLGSADSGISDVRAQERDLAEHRERFERGEVLAVFGHLC
jgi:hypothetical protein